MWANDAFWGLLSEGTLAHVSVTAVPPDPHEVARRGWVEDASGAWLLRAFRDSYHGSAESFDDLTGFEAAVNGRAVPDLDLPPTGGARIACLVRRAIAFARLALSSYERSGPVMVAYGLFSGDKSSGAMTGSLTFCAEHPGEPPYIENVGDDPQPIFIIKSSDQYFNGT